MLTSSWRSMIAAAGVGEFDTSGGEPGNPRPDPDLALPDQGDRAVVDQRYLLMLGDLH